MTEHAKGTFEVGMDPVTVDGVDGVATMTLRKAWTGDITGSGTGIFASAGDPGVGRAGYVALEVVDGRIGDRAGTFALQQYGQMAGGPPTLTYAVVPGSGTGHLAGITGTLELTIVDGVHHYDLAYELPQEPPGEPA